MHSYDFCHFSERRTGNVSLHVFNGEPGIAFGKFHGNCIFPLFTWLNGFIVHLCLSVNFPQVFCLSSIFRAYSNYNTNWLRKRGANKENQQENRCVVTAIRDFQTEAENVPHGNDEPKRLKQKLDIISNSVSLYQVTW